MARCPHKMSTRLDDAIDIYLLISRLPIYFASYILDAAESADDFDLPRQMTNRRLTI